MTGTTRSLPGYPKSAEEVTADNLAACLAVAAQRTHLKVMDSAAMDHTALTLFVREWGVVFLLREVQERAGVHVADGIARALWENWNDGSGLGEWLWEWLTEYGVDPNAIGLNAPAEQVAK